MTGVEEKNRSLKFLGWVIFIISIGEGMTAPAIPLLGKSFGASYGFIGLFMTGYSVTYGVMTLATGRISDMWGRKKVLIIGLILSLVAALGYCICRDVLSLFLFRSLEGFSRGILWVALEAILADNSSEENRNRAAGRFTASYGLGAMLGCLAGGFLMEYVSLTAVFPYYPVFDLMAIGLAFWGITELAGANESSHRSGITAGEVDWKYEIKKIWPICYAFFTYTGFLYSIWGLLSMLAAHFSVSYLGIGIIFGLFWSFRIVSFLTAGIVAERLGRKPVLMAGLAIASLGAAIFVLGSSFYTIIVGALFGGIGTGIIFTLTIAMVADISAANFKGSAMGILEFAGSLGMIAQTAASGILGQYGGVSYTYLFTMIVCLGGVFIIGAFVKNDTMNKFGAAQGFSKK